MTETIRICVPATTANIGPGFDSFGCALSLYNTFTFSRREEGYSFAGCDAAYCNADNLAAVAYRYTMDFLKMPQDGFHMCVEQNDVPICRGLGSSSTLIVAGVMAAAALHGKTLSRADMLRCATAVEGHPDNVAPAIYGGLSVSCMEGEAVATFVYQPHEKLHWIVMSPDFELSTEAARAALPPQPSRADAIFNVAHGAVLLEALVSGDAARIAFGLDDRIHQPYRSRLIAGYDAVYAAAKELGAIGVCISGAGPTVLALSSTPTLADSLRERLPQGWRVLALRCDTVGATCENV